MKIRTGFVSNSSSSSFVILLKDITKQQAEALMSRGDSIHRGVYVEMEEGYEEGKDYICFSYERTEDDDEKDEAIMRLLAELGVEKYDFD